jgi:hypothetical protein
MVMSHTVGAYRCRAFFQRVWWTMAEATADVFAVGIKKITTRRTGVVAT